MKLELTRPLVFFDLETTGLDIQTARIVEIAMIKLFSDDRTDSFLSLVNPEIPIPAGATKIHGINNLDVIDKPTISEISPDIHSFISNCDLAGYNIVNYDLPILINELKRGGIEFNTEHVKVIDVLRIFRLKERRDLSAAYRFYCNKELKDAHSALKDTQATLEILKAQSEKYHDLPQKIEALHQFCNQRDERFVDTDKKFIWEQDEACFTFGKYKGHPLKKVVELDREYLEWMVKQDFSVEVQQIIASALQGVFPKKAAASENNSDTD